MGLRRVFDDPVLDELTSDTLAEYGLVRYGPPEHDFVIDLTTRIVIGPEASADTRFAAVIGGRLEPSGGICELQTVERGPVGQPSQSGIFLLALTFSRSAWLALITLAHVFMNVNWDVVLNDRLPLDKRKLNVAYIPVT